MRAMEYRDNDTGMHVMRMGQYAMTIGRALELSPDDQEMLLLATPMHDIGKVATPDHILLKPGALAPDEWTIMQEHAKRGTTSLPAARQRSCSWHRRSRSTITSAGMVPVIPTGSRHRYSACRAHLRGRRCVRRVDFQAPV